MATARTDYVHDPFPRAAPAAGRAALQPWAGLCGVVLAAACVRAWMLFSTPFVPGMNGAYYLVQARSLLQKGALGLPDLPLTFALQAAVARLAQSFTRLALEPSVVLAVKLCDALLPPLVAVPVYLIVAGWCDRLGRSRWHALGPAALVALGAPAMSMVGDFQKNSLALVWLAALLAALAAWLAEPRAWRALPVLGCLALVGLTHIGVFGSALVVTASVLIAYAVRNPGVAMRVLLPWLGAAVIVVVAVAAVVSVKFDPGRIHRLITILADPSGGSGVQPGGPPPGLGGLFSPLRWLAAGLFVLAVAPGAVLAWRRRAELTAADFALVMGCAAAAILLQGPWVGGQMRGRLALIAVSPAVLTGAFAWLHLQPARWRAGVAVVAPLLMCGPTLPMAIFGPPAQVDEATYAELAGLRRLIPDPDRTLICAHHGLEWWTAWTLHTRVAQPRALKAEMWRSYESVYFLEEKGGWRPGRPPGPGGPPRFRSPGDPPPFGGPGGPPDGGPMQGPTIPSDATIVHDGGGLRLALVTHPPDLSTMAGVGW